MDINENQLTFKNRLNQCLVSSCLGILFGVIIGEMIGIVLLEISVSNVFAIFFGVAFIIMTLMILGAQCIPKPSLEQRLLFGVYAILLILSVIFSFLLHKNLSSAGKVFGLIFISISISIAFMRLIIELINSKYIENCFESSGISHVIYQPRQYLVLYFAAILLGFILGILFGVVPFENGGSIHLIYIIPISFVFGITLGFLNEWWRTSEINPSSYTWSTVQE